MSNLTFVTHLGDGNAKSFPITAAGEALGYFRAEDIHGYVNGEEVPTSIEPSSPHLLLFDTAPPLGSEVLIRRIVPTNQPYADFERGNNFGPRQINNSFLQQLYLTQELLDGFLPVGHYIKQDLDIGNHHIKNLGNGVDDTDAVNKGQLDSVEVRVGALEAGLVLDGIDNGNTIKVTPAGTDVAKTLTTLFGEAYSKGVKLSELGVSERDVNETSKIIDAFVNYEKVIIDGEYWVHQGQVPDSAKIQYIELTKGSILRLEGDLSFDFVLAGNLVIDMRKGGMVHGGRRGCILSRDHLVGETILDVEDASDILVGQNLSTSMAFEGTDINRGKWNNAIRNPDDDYNIVTDVDYNLNKVTVTHGVPDCRFPRGTYLQNNQFGRNGLTFRGHGEVFLLGGSVEESSAGYYMSGLTDIGEGTLPLTIYTDGTDFKGQGLDAFLLRGEKVNLVMDNFDISKTYDNAKQLVVQDTGGDVILRDGRVARGNYDVEFYPTGAKITLGRIFAQNVEWDGKSSLLVTPEQEWEDLSGVVGDTWNNIGDSLHVTQWASGVSRIETQGMIAIDCDFKNYRRSILGTTLVPTSNDVSIVGKCKFINCSMTCAPHYFVAGEGTTVYIAQAIEYVNIKVIPTYPDQFYLIGLLGSSGTGVMLNKPTLWTGRTTVEFVSTTPVSHRINLDGIFDELYFVGKSDGSSPLAKIHGDYIVNRVIARDVGVNKVEEGQGNQYVATIALGTHGSFVGNKWVSIQEPIWDSSTFLLTNNEGGSHYSGMAARVIYRKSANSNDWIPLCDLAPLNAENASAQVDFATAHTYGGAGKVCGSFYVTLPNDGTPVTASVRPTETNNVIVIANNFDAVYPITPIFLENVGAPGDLSAFSFRILNGTLQVQIQGTTDLGSFVTIRGNVVGIS